jgi:hypothetical protein
LFEFLIIGFDGLVGNFSLPKLSVGLIFAQSSLVVIIFDLHQILPLIELSLGVAIDLPQKPILDVLKMLPIEEFEAKIHGDLNLSNIHELFPETLGQKCPVGGHVQRICFIELLAFSLKSQILRINESENIVECLVSEQRGHFLPLVPREVLAGRD